MATQNRVGMFSIVCLGVYILFAYTALSTTTVSMPDATSNVPVATSLRSICQTHYLAYNLHSARPPETFFSLLGLDPTLPPFTSLSWTRKDDPQHAKAQDAIILAWAERKQRLFEQYHHDGASKDENVLDLVAYHLIDTVLAEVYVEVIWPSIRDLRGAKRLEKLKDLCKENWKSGSG